MRGYKKDFEGWSRLKGELQQKPQSYFFYEREIWWTAIGHNIGNEEDGKGWQYARPVLILRKFNSRLFWGIPLTSTQRHGKYYFRFWYGELLQNTALLSQLRVFDSRRLLAKKGIMGDIDFVQLQLKLVLLLRGQPQK